MKNQKILFVKISSRLEEFNEDTNRSCGSCYKRLHRRLEMINSNETSSDVFSVKQDAWRDDDVQRLKEGTNEIRRNETAMDYFFKSWLLYDDD